MAAANCPVCAGAAQTHLTIRGHIIAACDECSHQFCASQPEAGHVDREYDDLYFAGGGSGYPDYLADGELITAHAARYVPLIDGHLIDKHRASLLDVGCAAGFVMRGFAQAGWRVSGIDPNQTMVRHAQQQLGYDAHVATLESINASQLPIPDDGFDLITLIQVMAHFYDLERVSVALAALLRPGALLLVETWNSQSLTARTLGAGWHEYNPPNVLHNFTPKSLDTLMAGIGLQRVAAGRPAKRLSASHLRSALRHKYGGRAMASVLDKAVGLLPAKLTVPYPAEDLFWHLYRRT